MVSVITNSTLFSNADKNIFEIINTRSYIVDPKNRSSSEKFVYRNDPWSKGMEYGGYPYIILKFPQMERDNSSVNGNVKDISWTQRITVRSKMEGGVNNSSGTSKAVIDMQEIVDDLNQTFDSKTVKDILRATKIYNLVIQVDNNDEFVDSNGKHIFETELILTYNTRLSVGV